MSFNWLLRVLKGGRAKMLMSAKKNKHSIIIKALKKNRHPKLKSFFFISSYIPSRVFGGFEQLSSSI